MSDTLAEIAPGSEQGTPHTIEHVLGLRRSGHHAVLKWLQGCHEEAGSTTRFDDIKTNSVYNNHLQPFLPHWPDPSPEAVWAEGAGYDVLFVSYEDVDPDKQQGSPVYRALRAPEYGHVARETVVVRDWFNFVASRLTYQAKNAEKGRHNSLIFALEWPEVVERWLKHAQLALGGIETQQGRIAVNYNQWFTSHEYREEVALHYGLPNSDCNIDLVPALGSGSSFDGRTLDGYGSQMNVLRRWQELNPTLHQRYKRLVSNPLMGEINQQLFGIDQDAVLKEVSSS